MPGGASRLLPAVNVKVYESLHCFPLDVAPIMSVVTVERFYKKERKSIVRARC